MRNSFELNTHLFFWGRFISVLLCSQTILLDHIFYSYTLLKGFLRICNLSFCFQHYLFILKSVTDKFYYLEFIFLIYELNAVVSIYSDVFYPATSTLKMLYANMLQFACCVTFYWLMFPWKTFWFFITFIYYCMLCFFYPLT